jgi:hypothetical protein
MDSSGPSKTFGGEGEADLYGMPDPNHRLVFAVTRMRLADIVLKSYLVLKRPLRQVKLKRHIGR